MPGRTRQGILAALASLATLASHPGGASAYEFEIRARSIGQVSDLLGVRFATADLVLSRRRFTQTLALDIWDLGRRRRFGSLAAPPPRRGPRYSFGSYLRLDHDFGDFTSGDVRLPSRTVSAIDLTPELEDGALQLDVLYAYAAAEDLAGGALDLYAGRQLTFDALDFVAFDGVRGRLEGRLPLAVEALAGVRVREASPFGGPWTELDGSAGGECQEYVEGAAPGSGAWRPIDRRPGDDDPFRSDLDRCPQREAWMPLVGASLATARLPVEASLSYRRAMSRTPGLIGPVDRFVEPDRGLYPDELGQAPAWGVNEEHVTASARVARALGPVAIAPHAALRYSLLHGVVEQAHAGVPVRLGRHTLEPEVYREFPTFDGDSIFNVFSTEPYVDLRATWSWSPRGPLATYARGWGRRFRVAGAGQATPAAERVSWAGGGQGGLRWIVARRARARLDVFHEDGHGGRRTGGFVGGDLAVRRDLSLAARATVIGYREDLRPELRATSAGLTAGGTWRINRGVAFTLALDETTSRLDRNRFSAVALLDLAFRPEL
jgi:hypothetical protein